MGFSSPPRTKNAPKHEKKLSDGPETFTIGRTREYSKSWKSGDDLTTLSGRNCKNTVQNDLPLLAARINFPLRGVGPPTSKNHRSQLRAPNHFILFLNESSNTLVYRKIMKPTLAHRWEYEKRDCNKTLSFFQKSRYAPLYRARSGT